MNSNVKRFVPLVVAFVLLVASGLGTSAIVIGRNNEINKLREELTVYQGKLDQARLQGSSKTSEVKIESMGVDAGRIQRDETLATELLDTVFNWSSYAEYTAIREKLMSDYKLDANSSFLNTFMPEVYNEEIEGKQYNRIDIDGYNIRLNDITPYLVSSDEASDEYGYFAVVEVASSSKNGGTTRYKVALEYKTTKDGQLLDLKGYTLN